MHTRFFCLVLVNLSPDCIKYNASSVDGPTQSWLTYFFLKNPSLPDWNKKVEFFPLSCKWIKLLTQCLRSYLSESGTVLGAANKRWRKCCSFIHSDQKDSTDIKWPRCDVTDTGWLSLPEKEQEMGSWEMKRINLYFHFNLYITFYNILIFCIIYFIISLTEFRATWFWLWKILHTIK